MGNKREKKVEGEVGAKNNEEAKVEGPFTLKRKVKFSVDQSDDTESEQDDLSLLNDYY